MSFADRMCRRSVFAVGSGRALVAVASSPFQTGSEPSSVVFSPRGGLLATANAIENTVTVYAPSGSALAATLVADSAGKGPGSALADKATATQTAVNAGLTATACADITNDLGLVKAQTGKKLSKGPNGTAALLTQDATSLAAAIGC